MRVLERTQVGQKIYFQNLGLRHGVGYLFDNINYLPEPFSPQNIEHLALAGLRFAVDLD